MYIHKNTYISCVYGYKPTVVAIVSFDACMKADDISHHIYSVYGYKPTVVVIVSLDACMKADDVSHHNSLRFFLVVADLGSYTHSGDAYK